MAAENTPMNIGSRVEMMIDHALIHRTYNVHLKLNPPTPREIVLRMEMPWEGSGSGIYSNVFFDGEKYRMHYRASAALDADTSDRKESQYNCLAVSTDGVHWERPILNQVEFLGNKENNILFSGHMAHNFSPMLDPRPDCPPQERYKAVAGHAPQGLMGYKSADGLHWETLQDTPIITEGHFDSHNLCFYDASIQKYRCYSRYFANPIGCGMNDISEDNGAWIAGSPVDGGSLSVDIRSIQSCVSDDFLHWTQPAPNLYPAEIPQEQFYTNATLPCPGAEHHILSFPMRFMCDRRKNPACAEPGVSDAVFLSSRDGIHFDRTFPESWIRPDLDPRNWTQRNFITAWGILQTSAEEFSFYVGEHYEWDDAYIRRYTVRRHGFGSVNASYSGGYFLTKPFIFDGSKLYLNYATGAPGSIRVSIANDGTGWPAPGFSAEDCDIIYGNELEKAVTWRGNADLSQFAGKPIQLKFEMKDADLYAFHFGE